MRAIEKSKYKSYLDKGRQHAEVAAVALTEKYFDAAVTNCCIALINYLDALSVNRFGKDLSSDNHEAAPITLLNQLSGVGISDFKPLSRACVEVLKMKNVASYRDEPLDAEKARRAQKVVKETRAFVEAKIDPKIGIG